MPEPSRQWPREGLGWILALPLLAFLPGIGDPPPETRPDAIPRTPGALVVFGTDTLRVEVADTEEARTRGLMFRGELAPDAGMLFLYPEPTELSFWMRDTLIPLDLAFLDDEGSVLSVVTLEPFSEELHTSPVPVRMALEVNAGWFRARTLGVGARALVILDGR
jgi:uncharacterized protein